MRLRGEGEYIKVVNTWVTYKELEKQLAEARKKGKELQTLTKPHL
jgi:uncharacterized FlgJ-related protein